MSGSGGPWIPSSTAPTSSTAPRSSAPKAARTPRAPIQASTSPYDIFATEYDARFLSPEHFHDHLRLRELIAAAARIENPTVVDIGAGTGFRLDLGITTPDRYTAVDPSQGMLNHLVI